MVKEKIIAFDAMNRFAGIIPRSQAGKNKELWYRTQCVFVRSGQKFVVQKRSVKKSWCPGYYDLAFGGALNPEDFFGERQVDEQLDANLVDSEWD